MQRFALYILLGISGLAFPWWFFLVCVLIYACRYTAYEAILLGAVLDAYAGVPVSAFPLPVFYTLTTLVVVFGVEWMRPYLVFGER